MMPNDHTNKKNTTMTRSLLYSTIMVLCATMFVAGIAVAQTNLTIEDAVKIGLEQNRELKISILKAKNVGDARISEIEANRLPSLKLLASYTRLSDIGITAINVPIPGIPPLGFRTYFPDNYSVKLSLNQPIFTGFRLQNQENAAEHTSNAAKADTKSDSESIVFTIKQQYWTLYKLQRTLAVVEKNIVEAKAHLEDIKSKLSRGVALPSDTLKALVQVSSSELQQIQTQKNIRVAMAALMNTLSLPIDETVTLTGVTDESSSVSGSLAELVSKAKKNRPELIALDERIQAADANVKVAHAGYYPQVSVGANVYYQDPNQRYFPAQNAFKTTWDASVNLSWDIWNWNISGLQGEQAQYAEEELRETKKQLEESIALEVTQNYLAAQTSLDQIAVAKLTVAQADENLRVTKEQYARGVATNTDVIDAETLSMQSMVNYVTAITDAKIASAQLERSVGE